MERPLHQEGDKEVPHGGSPQKKWHWWYGYEEDLHKKKKSPAKEISRSASRGSHETPIHREAVKSKKKPDTKSDSLEIPYMESWRQEKTEGQPKPETEKISTKEEAEASIGKLIFQDLLNNPALAGVDDNEKKKRIKEDLREIKHKIQESDYERVKAITDKGGLAPWRTNINWNKASKTGKEGKPLMRFWRHEGKYKAAWRELRKWADEQGVWDEKVDQREFDRETEAGTPWAIRETVRAAGFDIAVAGIYGIGYALIAPWKGFELGLKYASMLTGDQQYTHGMMEKLFKKKREKTAKGEPKKEEWNKAKEYEVMQKIKEIEINYIKELKGDIIEQKAHGDMKPEEYMMLTDERKNKLRETIGKRGYENVWRTLRVHWIQEGAWSIKDEQEFREVINNDLQLRDIMTQEEYNTFVKIKKREANIEKEIKAATDEEKRGTLKKELVYIEGRIADIENRKKVRTDAMQWPEYKRGRKKGGTSVEDFVTTEDEADEDEEEGN